VRIGLRLAPQNRVYAGFAIYSFCLGNIFPRLPDIQRAMDVEEGALGLGLIGTPVGTLVALTFATPVLERIGFRRALLAAIPLMAAAFAVAVHARDPASFFILLLPVGVMIGCIEIILNVEADRTEALVGRRIMNRAHSFWSIGFFAAGLSGGTIAQAGISPQAHLALLVPVSVIAVALFLGHYEPSPKRAEEGREAAPRLARPSGAILILVAVTLSAMLMEGASMDWSAIYMRDVFAAAPFLAGLAVTVFALAQAITRFFADSFVDRHSPATVARVLLCVMTAGVVLVFFSPLAAVSLLGFALLGAGTSAIFPLAISAAAQRGDRPAAINVAALAQISFIVFLLGPPLLGFVAEHWGIRWSFGIGLPLVAVSLSLAGALGHKQPPRRAAYADSNREKAGVS
jgi:MFS family permease